MIRWLFKWLFRLSLMAVLLAVVLLLSLNSILRVLIEHNIRAQTGMDAEMGRFKLGWMAPTIEIEDLKIYNAPNFGGAPFLDIPEIHAEYDRAALLKKEIHLTLLRFNLGELDIVKNQNGQMNIYALTKPPRKSPGAASAPSFKKQNGYAFKGIDALNVSFGQAKFIDLKNPNNDREQTIGIQNLVIPNVKSPADLTMLIVLIDLRGGHFFDGLIGKPQNSAPMKSIINLLGTTF